MLAGTPAKDLDLEALVNKLGVSDRVLLRLGFLPESELAGLLDGTDAVALPYLQIDNTGIGAAARDRGLPAVASDLPPLRELFGDAAVYARPGDVDDLARALVDLPENFRRLARRARERLPDHRALMDEYRRLAQRWAGRVERSALSAGPAA